MVVTEPKLDGSHVAFPNANKKLGFNEIVSQGNGISDGCIRLIRELLIFLSPMVISSPSDADVLASDGEAGIFLELGEEIRFLFGDPLINRVPGFVSNLDFFRWLPLHYNDFTLKRIQLTKIEWQMIRPELQPLPCIRNSLIS